MMPLVWGLGCRGGKVYPSVNGLDFGIRREMEQALITESFVI